MSKKKEILALLLILSSMLTVIFAWGDWGDPLEPILEVSVSGDYFKYGSTSIDEDGYPEPPSGNWIPDAISAWRHPTWKRVNGIDSLYDAGADWIWRVYKTTLDSLYDEAKTGSTVFFVKEIVIPDNAGVSDVTLHITVDNAFYLYIASAFDGAEGPVWSGPPLGVDGDRAVDGFFNSGLFDEGENPGSLWEIDENNFYVPKPGAIDIDKGVVRSIEEIDLTDYLKPGTNWLSIVAFNAQPEPKSKQTSINQAGLIYKLEISRNEPLIIAPGVRVPLEDPVPVINYTLPLMTLSPVQAVWECDLEGTTGEDGVFDMVLGKPMAVQVSYVGETSLPDSIHVTLEQSNPITLADDDPTDEIFSVYPFVPTEQGPLTITGYALWGATQVDFPPVYIKVLDTSEPLIAFSHIYKEGRRVYGTIEEYNYTLMVEETADFINGSWPVANITIDPNFIGIAGADKAKKNDPYRAMLDDCVAVATDAKWRLGTDAFGIGIGPNRWDLGYKDYFEYHGQSNWGGISFGQSVRGVIVLDGFTSLGAHELGHSNDIGIPEYYDIYPPNGPESYGVEIGYDPVSGPYANWRSGTCFMGAGAYKSIEDHWVSNEVYELLFEKLMDPLQSPDDPVIISGAIWNNGTVEVSQGIRVSYGITDEPNENGNYAFIYFDEFGDEIDGEEFPFLAIPRILVEPVEGTSTPPPEYGEEPTDFAAFSLSIPLHPAAKEIWLIDRSMPHVPNHALAIIYVNDLVQFDTWMTDSTTNQFDTLNCHFKYDQKTDTYTLVGTNTGSFWYNALIDYNGEATLTVTLTEILNGEEQTVNAFQLASENYLKIYSDRERTNEITDTIAWTNEDDLTFTIPMNIPTDEVRYVTIHLKYALQNDPGWELDDPSDFYQDLSILAEPIPFYDPFLDRYVELDLTTEFKAIGIK